MALEINKIYCADCLDLMKEMEDNSVDLVLTDPPYNINLQPQRKKTKKIINDNFSNEDFIRFLDPICRELKRIQKNNSFLISFCGWSTIPEFRMAFDKCFDLKSMLIWVKNVWGIGYYTRPQYEPCFLYFKGKPQPLKNPISDVLCFDRLMSPIHSCQKPLPLIEYLLKSFSKEGQTIFDPFLGSGTTAVACINTGRNFIGIEKDPEYYEIAQRRIKRTRTGKDRSMVSELREYQREAVDAFFSGLRAGVTSGIIAAPTGSGKSLIISNICKTLISGWTHTHVIVATHTKDLIQQDIDEFKKYYPGASCGIYSAGLNKRQNDRRVSFVGIQSVHKRAFEFNKIDLLIIDEAHKVNTEEGTQYARFIRDLKIANPNLCVLGMSATPYRLDNGLLYEGKDRLFETLYYEIELSRLIDEGFLCPVISKGAVEKIDLDGVKTTAGDYNKKSLELAADKEALTRSAVDEIMRYGKDRNAWLIFASGVEHAGHICEEIRSRGVTCAVVTGETDNTKRDQILEDYKHRIIRCLVNVEILVAGFNAPETDLVALLMATKSTSKYVQSVGRGTRLAPGKDDCLLLDFGGNVIRHGPVDSVVAPSAKIKGDGDGIAPCKECPECHSIVPASARFCGAPCFHEFEQKPAHESTAYDGAVLSKQEEPVWWIVEEVGAFRHKKAGKPDSIKMEFHCIGREFPFCQWLALDHGGYATNKAKEYIRAAGGVAACVDDALREYFVWKDPTRILVKRDKKYFRIVAFDFPENINTQQSNII